MITKKIGDFTGVSTSGIQEAIKDALEKAGEHGRFEVIETMSTNVIGNKRQYQVTLATFDE